MISIVRLSDGTELVGDVVDVNSESIVIVDPLQINYKITILQPAPSMGLSRFMPFSGNFKFEIPVNSITTMMKARESMATYYKHALETYITDLDAHIDDELVRSAMPEQQDVYTQLLEKFNPPGHLQ